MHPRTLAAVPALALVFVACDGRSTNPTPMPSPAPTPLTENFSYLMRLTPTQWPLSGPEFEARPGEIVVTARVDSPVRLTYSLGLAYVGGAVAHDEGTGGIESQGPGPLLTGRWKVGFAGRYRAFIYLPGATAPLPVPSQGVNVPIVFSITHS